MKTCVAVSMALCVWFAPGFAADQPAGAETVLLNGIVLTVDARDSVAQALALSKGKILEVGSDESVKRFIGAGTRVVDLEGRTVTPGLIDTHFHMDGNLAHEVNAGYPAVKSIPDVLARVRDKIRDLKPGEWVLGRGWDEGKLIEQRYIRASDLDPVSPDNPIYIAHTTGHYAVVNSRALELAGMGRDTPDPPAGTIDRDASGSPTGVLKEHATTLVSRLIPPYSAQRQREGFLRVLRDLNAEGMTAVKDPGISAEKWEIYRDMLRAGELTARIFALWENKGTLESTKE